MLKQIREANLILEQQGIKWRLLADEDDAGRTSVTVRNHAGQVLFRGYTVEGAIQWIIRQPIPDEDLEPFLGYEDEIYEIMLMFAPVSRA